MYKLLIIDDEEIEREGMAQFIPWSDYDIELVGTAWNGMDGYDKIQKTIPDIVLTDIKMPVMDGISLIRKVKSNFQDIEFIVLSGYGEYEFTSQAMEEGVRHYILKPCDESKIVSIINKVKKEINQKREKRNIEKEYYSTVPQLLQRAKDQVFQNILLAREQLKDDYQLFLKEVEDEKKKIQVISLRSLTPFNNLEQFIIGNILGEVLGKNKVLLSTAIQKDVLFLIEIESIEIIERAVIRIKQEFKRVKNSDIQVAVSEIGDLRDVDKLYTQIQELYRIGSSETKDRLLHYELFKEIKYETSNLIDCERIQKTDDYAQILFEVYLSFIKMNLRGDTFQKKVESCRVIIKILYGHTWQSDWSILEGKEDTDWKLIEDIVGIIVHNKNVEFGKCKEEQRVRNILLAFYRYIQYPEMSIQFLAKEVLFMNEDYFGRIFAKNRKVKFSTFLLNQRIALAQRLLQYDSEMKISQLAELVGYSPDGQYFSKAFRKVTGMSPSEFREKLINKK
ncbi:MAG: response regulator [Clostridium sp.]|uniref:response regulator transcription factor n=1 Tax=Clostridium sp. TaxID=1506 RepID=UPI002907CD94|nr:response regulator [Clostridium sp.]MDU5109908.1 response regulator [Clostridium sp.]